MKQLNRKAITVFTAAMFVFTFAACNDEKESASSIAQRWCELNGIAHRAEEGAAKEAAKKELKDYEKSIEAKHDKAFMAEVEKEVGKCEAASEGR